MHLNRSDSAVDAVGACHGNLARETLPQAGKTDDDALVFRSVQDIPPAVKTKLG
jgi:hypothetical protein